MMNGLELTLMRAATKDHTTKASSALETTTKKSFLNHTSTTWWIQRPVTQATTPAKSTRLSTKSTSFQASVSITPTTAKEAPVFPTPKSTGWKCFREQKKLTSSNQKQFFRLSSSNGNNMVRNIIFMEWLFTFYKCWLLLYMSRKSTSTTSSATASSHQKDASTTGPFHSWSEWYILWFMNQCNAGDKDSRIIGTTSQTSLIFFTLLSVSERHFIMWYIIHLRLSLKWQWLWRSPSTRFDRSST